ncbi:hypothetical protein M8J75_013600 [Diaphorina citri]|nr:hypothetical protein M8J75_013600 [Diaphorina citri]
MAYRGALLAYSLVFLCALSVVGDADVSTPVRSSFLEDPGYFETEDSIIVEGCVSVTYQLHLRYIARTPGYEPETIVFSQQGGAGDRKLLSTRYFSGSVTFR